MLPVICIHLSWVMVRDWASRLQVLKLSCITVNTSIAKIAKHCSKVLFLSPWMLPRSGMELVWYRRSNMCHRDMQLPIESWSSSEIALNATPHSQAIQTLPTHNTVTERMFNVFVGILAFVDQPWSPKVLGPFGAPWNLVAQEQKDWNANVSCKLRKAMWLRNWQACEVEKYYQGVCWVRRHDFKDQWLQGTRIISEHKKNLFSSNRSWIILEQWMHNWSFRNTPPERVQSAK